MRAHSLRGQPCGNGCFRDKSGPIAQFRLERTPDKREVGGSSPPRPTISEDSGQMTEDRKRFFALSAGWKAEADFFLSSVL